MRIVVSACALLTVSVGAGCRGPDPWPEFFTALRDAPAGAAARIAWRDGRIHRLRAPLADRAIPAAAQRTADAFLQPGGTPTFRGREWHADGTGGFRFVATFAAPHGRRSALVTATGEVLERSHEIPVTNCPAAARDAAAARGEIQRVEVVQGAAGAPEWFHFTIQNGGQQHFLRCLADGSSGSTGRILPASLHPGSSR